MRTPLASAAEREAWAALQEWEQNCSSVSYVRQEYWEMSQNTLKLSHVVTSLNFGSLDRIVDGFLFFKNKGTETEETILFCGCHVGVPLNGTRLSALTLIALLTQTDQTRGQTLKRISSKIMIPQQVGTRSGALEREELPSSDIVSVYVAPVSHNRVFWSICLYKVQPQHFDVPALLIFVRVYECDVGHHVYVNNMHTHNNIKLHVDATARQDYILLFK